MNHITLIGALARNPELRYTPNGTPVYEATIAGERSAIKADGSPVHIPFYHRVQILGKRAEVISELNLQAGQVLLVSGQLNYSNWEDDKGRHSMVRVKITEDFREVPGEHELIQDAGGGVRLKGGLNLVNISGNIGQDPELRYTGNADAVCEVSVAWRETYMHNGERKENTHWFRVTFWRELAEKVALLKKGDPIFVQGALSTDSYTDKEGNKRSVQKIEGLNFTPLMRSNREGTGNAAPVQTQAQAAPTQAAPVQAQAAQAAPVTRQSASRTTTTTATKAAQTPAPVLDIDEGLVDFPDYPEDESLPF